MQQKKRKRGNDAVAFKVGVIFFPVFLPVDMHQPSPLVLADNKVLDTHSTSVKEQNHMVEWFHETREKIFYSNFTGSTKK